MKLEVSPWAGRLLVGLATLALLTVTVVAGTLLPFLPRLVRAAEALPTAVQVVRDVPATQQQVARIDANVQTVTPQVTAATRDLRDLAPQLQTLSAQLAAAETTIEGLQHVIGTAPAGDQAGLVAQLAGLQTSVGRVAAALEPLAPPLSPMAADLHRLAGQAGALQTSLDRLNTSAEVLAQLPAWFQALQRSMDDMAVHVRNLDRKTGPVIP
jgi:septal ring factor EnvC (AmiA/AmiB activator)